MVALYLYRHYHIYQLINQLNNYIISKMEIRKEENEMRVTWKDSALNVKTYKPIKYRNHVISGYIKDGVRGWILDIEGDYNIYKSNYCAMNAIDKHIGEDLKRKNASEKRKKCGIEVVGIYKSIEVTQ